MTAIPEPTGEVLICTLGPNDPPASHGELIKRNFDHSQFAGSWTYQVTRIDGNDVYGEYYSGTAYEMDIEDVM